ncbi:cupredoxin domain-containing protein [Cohnella phaseoli]|uniref:Cytochrome c oxidase subunit 2 n=1 Tax=Cohnella phaseoli TaxID=456490 RepID=A0A3D9JRL1_9BACL|nr:cupredoxin domain-containing protein [Cohnella phaseoli]RED76076.1 cytochrome c oxidase subunit 2 [Cohnella phaseoli]
MTSKKFYLTIAGILALALVTAACGKSNNMRNMNMSTATSPSSSSDTAGEAQPSQVNVVATNWSWELSQSTFKVGETVAFNIQGKEGSHGFAIEGTNIDQQIAAGKTEIVTWTPDKAGEYEIKCSVICGTGHGDMVIKIEVVE